jgi:hypothetical protein
MEKQGAPVNRPISLQLVGEDEPADRCAELGTRIAWSSQRVVALLAMADGSAAGPQGSGLPARPSAPFDADVERAVRTDDLAALLAID